jgi:hypothetical protein
VVSKTVAHRWLSLPLAVFVLAVTPGASALDTLEPYATGLSDLELYVGADGLRPNSDEQLLFLEAGVGAGLTPRLSMFVGYDATTDSSLNAGQSGVSATLYANVLDRSPFALDLGLSLGQSGGSGSLAPFFELNWDRAPDQEAFGLFIHGGPAAAGDGRRVDWSAELGTGAYWTAAQGHQLFLEWTTGYDLGASPWRRAWQHGALCVGYNAMLTDTLELVTQAGLSLPQKAMPVSASAMAGLIATFEQ